MLLYNFEFHQNLERHNIDHFRAPQKEHQIWKVVQRNQNTFLAFYSIEVLALHHAPEIQHLEQQANSPQQTYLYKLFVNLVFSRNLQTYLNTQPDYQLVHFPRTTLRMTHSCRSDQPCEYFHRIDIDQQADLNQFLGRGLANLELLEVNTNLRYQLQ